MELEHADTRSEKPSVVIEGFNVGKTAGDVQCGPENGS
jgi:hypothetical protein